MAVNDIAIESASLVGLFDAYSGVLEDDACPGRLIYFEMIDIQSIPPYKLVDLLRMMTDKRFKVVGRAREEEGAGKSIRFVSLNKNMSISGKDKTGEYKIRREIFPKKIGGVKIDKKFYQKKAERLADAVERYNAGKIIAINDILSGKHDLSKKEFRRVEDVMYVKSSRKRKLPEEAPDGVDSAQSAKQILLDCKK